MLLLQWNTECSDSIFDNNGKLIRILVFCLRRFYCRNACRLCVTELPGLSKSLEGAWIFFVPETPLRVTSRSGRSSLLLESRLGNWQSSYRSCSSSSKQ